MTESHTIEREAISVGEALTSPDAAFTDWQARRPKWLPISDYRGGDVLFRFGENLDDIVYGTRRPDGAWVGFHDGAEYRLDEAHSETFRNLDADGREILTDGVCESYTVTREAKVPTHFCDITPEAAIHFLAI